jgi:hypothetical protein
MLARGEDLHGVLPLRRTELQPQGIELVHLTDESADAPDSAYSEFPN